MKFVITQSQTFDLFNLTYYLKEYPLSLENNSQLTVLTIFNFYSYFFLSNFKPLIILNA